MKSLYNKKSMKINFNRKNGMSIIIKRKKEDLIYRSLISEARMQLAY